MDENKREKLKEINYKIRRCCGRCAFRNFAGCLWGTCKNHSYNHKKHSDSKRELSINVFGFCSYFKSDKTEEEQLGLFMEFTE